MVLQRRDLRVLIRDALMSDSVLLDMLAEGEKSLYPVAGQSPTAATKTPFIVTRITGELGENPIRAGWTMFVYDDPNEGYGRINDILNELHSLFNNYRFPQSAPGYTHYILATNLAAKSGELTEDEWAKNYRFIRFTAWGVHS